MEPPLCTHCGKRRSFYFRRYSGEKLCQQCFVKNVEGLVWRYVKREQLFKEGERVALAISGGKDSYALAQVMRKIAKRFKLDLVAIFIDEGIGGYREEALQLVKQIAKIAEAPLYTSSFKEIFGMSLDEIHRKSMEKGLEFNMCTFCGTLRRRAINDLARELNASKVAVGHNLDDEAQTVFMNLIRGNLIRLAIRTVLYDKRSAGLIPRVKPLRNIPENEVALYAYLKGAQFYERECPYVRVSMRDEVRNILNTLEEKHPGVKFSIVRSADKLAALLKEHPAILERVKIRHCKNCGAPTTRELCRVCELFQALAS